jgi:hypothetical protein
MTRLNSDPLDLVRDALLAAGCDPKGNQRITAKCPAHDDGNPSLSVGRGTEQAVVFHCHANCHPDAILAALRLEWSDLCEDDETYERPVERRVVASYPYLDEHGVALFEVVRFDPKDFRQRRPDGTWGVKDVRRVLFRLPDLVKAVRGARTVYVCEGEKDVLAVERAGEVATCNAGGAGKWRDEYDPFFAGANVVVVGDDDEPGHRHALDVARHLKGVATSVRVMLPVAGAKDVAEHLGRGLGLADLRPFEARPPSPSDDGWEPPAPLGPKERLPVFPAHRFPPWLDEMCVALARSLQTPVDLPAMLALSVLGSMCGGRCVVEIRRGWREPLNIFTATALPPGERKTPVFMRMIRPLEIGEVKALDAIRPEIADARTRSARAKAKADKAEDDAARASEAASEEAIHFAAQMRLMAEAITVPVPPRLLADDATPESLTSLLAEQGGRLALFSDEGEVFNMMAGRYSTSGPNLAVYLKSHVGSPIRVDRKGRDAEIIERPALSLGLTIQPEMLQSVAGIHGARGRGLLARFLWSVPASKVGHRLVDAPPVPEETEETYMTEMGVLFDSLREWTDPAVIVFTPEADAAMATWERALEVRLADRGDLAHISDWGAKLAGHTARIAGQLHMAANVRTGWAEAVEASTLADAIHIAEYLIAHAFIAFDAMEMDPLVGHARAVVPWLEQHGEFSRRDFFKAHQYRFKTVANAEPVLELLCEHGFIQQLPKTPTTGRGRPPGPRYIVNPLNPKSAT